MDSELYTPLSDVLLSIVASFASCIFSECHSLHTNSPEIELSTMSHNPSTMTHNPAARLHEEFIHDGREIMCIAHIIGADGFVPSVVHKYVKHAIDTRYNGSSFPTDESGFMKFLFQMHADTYRISLREAIDKWIPKLELVYTGAPFTYRLHELKNIAEVEEWNICDVGEWNNREIN
jgi:hypothetical protein